MKVLAIARGMRQGLKGLLLVSHSLFPINRSVMPVLRLVPVHSWFNLQISQEPLCFSWGCLESRVIMSPRMSPLSQKHQCHL